MLSLCQWLHSYHQKLLKYVDDDRLQKGIKIMINIYSNRSFDNIEQIILNIIEREKHEDP